MIQARDLIKARGIACCGAPKSRRLCRRCASRTIQNIHVATCVRANDIDTWRRVRNQYGRPILVCPDCAGDYPQQRPPIPAKIRAAVIARDGLACHWCGTDVVRKARGEPHRPDHLHLDHVVPYAQVQTHEISNLVVACADCNMRRPGGRPHD